MINKVVRDEKTTDNEHIGEIAAVCPQKRQYEFGSYYPARTFVKPLPRQYATTLSASGVERAVPKMKCISKMSVEFAAEKS